MQSAPVFNISRCSLHDGDGVRTVLYLNGCNMRCLWCHNPESHLAAPEVLFHPERCIGCGRCLQCCPTHAHTAQDNRHVLLRDRCVACGTCCRECPSKALELCGQQMTSAEVTESLLRDKHYFDFSGGGVTFSGGECLLYPDFLRETMELCRAHGIHTAIETALHVPWENVEPLIPLTDLFFCDLKHSDSQTHQTLTGVHNDRILQNLARLSERHHNIIVRIPLIPTLNDSDENLRRSADIVSGLPGVRGIELLKYNNMASGKCSALGKTFTPFGEPQSDEIMQQKRDVLRAVLPPEKFVR